MLLMPLQLLAAAERGLAHQMGSVQAGSMNQASTFVAHAMEHADHVAHHHHEDGSTHVDNSMASALHLLDCEKCCAMGLALPMQHAIASFAPPAGVTPPFEAGFVPDRTSSPPLRPPHAPA